MNQLSEEIHEQPQALARLLDGQSGGVPRIADALVLGISQSGQPPAAAVVGFAIRLSAVGPVQHPV